jgi:hypothetical protein
MKTAVWIGILIGGIIGGAIGNLFDHKSFFSLTNFGEWTIVLSGVGSIVGIWVSYKIYKNYF